MDEPTNAQLLRRDAALFGVQFVDVTGERIDPREVLPGLPEVDRLLRSVVKATREPPRIGPHDCPTCGRDLGEGRKRFNYCPHCSSAVNEIEVGPAECDGCLRDLGGEYEGWDWCPYCGNEL